MTFHFSRQDGIKECGVCVLYNMIKYYNGNIDINKLKNLVKTDKDGTSIYHIVEASKKLGLDSKSYKCNLSDIQNIEMPIVVHMNIEEKYPHYMILKEIVFDDVYLFDPIRGDIKYKIDLFLKEWTNIIIVFKKTKYIVNEKDFSFKFIKNIFNLYKKKIIFIWFLSIFFSSISFFAWSQYKLLYDNSNAPNKKIVIILLSFILTHSINYIKNKKIISLDNSINYKISSKLYKKILYLPSKFHHKTPAPDLLTRINDLKYVSDFSKELLDSFIINIFLLIFIVFTLLMCNNSYFLLSTSFLLLYLLVYIIFRDDLINYNYDIRVNYSNLNISIVENLLGINSIKNLNLEDQFLNKQLKSLKKYNASNKKLNLKYNKFNIIEDSLTSFYMVISIYIGILLVKNNTISFGSLIMIMSILDIYIGIIKYLISLDVNVLNLKNSIKRLKQTYYLNNKDDHISKNIFSNNIEIKNLKYTYNKKEELFNINFKINKDDKILVTGPSGSGKSTIFKLIVKDLEIEKGQILFDGKSINKFSEKDLKSQICYVPQNSFLFTDSIENNIKMFRKISKKEYEKALRTSGVTDFLEKRNINDKYLIEENGNNISGGEKQRIIISRVLLSKANFIIFDETMNEIDILSERSILKKITTEYKKTIILISHRKSNEDLFNRIIEVKEGKLYERIK